VSFASPVALLCLFAVPLALFLHLEAQRRRRRYPVRFTALSTLAAVAQREPPWRKHAPFVLLLAALAALTLSFARPQKTVAVPIERASVVLVTDISRSMSATDVSPTRLEAARRAAKTFVDKVPKSLRVGLVAFSDGAQTLQAPTTDRKAVQSGLDLLQPLNGTATGAGLSAALDALSVRGKPVASRPPSAVVLLSDGAANDGDAQFQIAAEAKRLHVPIFTVALGTPDGTIEQRGQAVRVPPDPEALKRIATISGGSAFQAEDSDELGAVYDKLGSQIGTKAEKREITTMFAGFGLLLLGAAVASSLALGGRLP
jgi:Ca-activated chloride channel family protein